MDYKKNTTCYYSNLNLYQNAKCGYGIKAPVFSGAPFLSQFSDFYKNCKCIQVNSKDDHSKIKHKDNKM